MYNQTLKGWTWADINGFKQYFKNTPGNGTGKGRLRIQPPCKNRIRPRVAFRILPTHGGGGMPGKFWRSLARQRRDYALYCPECLAQRHRRTLQGSRRDFHHQAPQRRRGSTGVATVTCDGIVLYTPGDFAQWHRQPPRLRR